MPSPQRPLSPQLQLHQPHQPQQQQKQQQQQREDDRDGMIETHHDLRTKCLQEQNQEEVESPRQPEPEQEPDNQITQKQTAHLQQRRLSNISSMSSASCRSIRSNGVAPSRHCGYCTVGSSCACVQFHAVERLEQCLPSFPFSQAASTGYVLLLPMDDPSLASECTSLRQRLDEVRFNAKVGSSKRNGTPTGHSTLRLAHVKMYNTDGPGLNSIGNYSEAKLPQDNCCENEELAELTGSTFHIGAVVLGDVGSLFETLVVKIAEWLLKNGALNGS